MIPLYKLEKLPRVQKLRKIAKVFSMAEARLCLAMEKKAGAKSGGDFPRGGFNAAGIFTISELVFFADAAKLLAKENFSHSLELSGAAERIFKEAADIFERAVNLPVFDAIELRRALNGVKHLLLTETGKEQADWDFLDKSDFINTDGKLDPAGRKVFEGMYVYLEDIRSPFNVGAMFRSAESFGVEKMFLSPFCADPRHKRAERTAMGCVDIVPWERKDFFAPIEDPLSGEKPELPFPVFALETGGVPIMDFAFPRRALMIAGSEELGVSPQALAAADASLGRVSIPCYGAKASLNVSVAVGIALDHWARSQASAGRR